ncbi:hypothetical protein V1525DRAFT_359799 [Lipomyces kononenkoae]|uniref:Uncharacterized protein n=1 Tax=Lipomyces kononenkoae TaxID=34357 RepID=A0ACC3T3Z8_LIPKO
MRMPAPIAYKPGVPGQYESSTAFRTGQNGNVLAPVSSNITNPASGSRSAGMPILKVQHRFPERRDSIEDGRTVQPSRSATLPSRREQSHPLQYILTGKMEWYQTMVSAQLPPLLASTSTIASSSSPPKKQIDSKFSALDTIDHSSLTCFAEILSSADAGTETEEHDDLPSDHVAYSLSFVDDYIATPLSDDGCRSIDCEIEIDRVAGVQFDSFRCDSCTIANNNSAVVMCKCCRYRLCERCFGPRLANFKFPRIPKDGSGPTSGKQQGGSQLKDLCEKCIRSCAGPHKRPGCQLRNAVSTKSGARDRNSSRQWSHKRQLTQMSLTAISATNTHNTSQWWGVKIITFLWRLTTFTIHSFNLDYLFRSETDRLRIADSEVNTRRRRVGSESETRVVLLRSAARVTNNQHNWI